MIEQLQADILHRAGYIKKHRGVFFYELDDAPTLDQICEKNNLKLPMSEWWDAYYDRELWMRNELNKKHIIPIITKEECISWGL